MNDEHVKHMLLLRTKYVWSMDKTYITYVITNKVLYCYKKILYDFVKTDGNYIMWH